MTPEAIVQTAVQEQLGVIAVTDHNEISNVESALAAAPPDSLLVVPGVELSTPQGHLLCYLPDLRALQSFHGRLTLAERDGPNSRCTTAMAECLTLLADVGGFGILAHVDADGGLERAMPGASPHKLDILCHSALLGIELKSATSEIAYSDEDPEQSRAGIGKARIDKLGLSKNQCLARVLNSDSHTLAALGRNADGDRRITRFKMDRPSFSALRLALQDADARVRLEEKIPRSIPQIVGAAFDGGFLDAQRVHFSRNLNCIIGGRGAGKSTLFEGARCLARRPSDSNVLDSDIWPRELHLVWQDQAGERHLLRRSLNADLENVNSPTGPVDFEIDCFGQGETAKVSAEADSNPAALLGYLDRFVDIAEAQTEEDTARDELLSLQQLIEEAEKKVAQIPLHERELAVTRQQLNALEKARAKEVIGLQRRLAEEATIRSQITDKVKDLKGVLDSGGAKHSLDEIRQLADPAQLRVGADEFQAIVACVDSFETNATAAETQLKTGLRSLDAEVQEELRRWKEKEASVRSRIDARRLELEQQGVRLDMAYIRKLTSDEASYKKSVTDLNSWKPRLAELRKKRSETLDARWRARERIATLRDGYARGATRALREALTDLTVTVRFVKNGYAPDAAALIVETMGWRTVQVLRAALLTEKLTVPALLNAIENRDHAAITKLRTAEGGAVFDKGDADLLFERLGQPHVRYALERCEIQDFPRLIVQKTVQPATGAAQHISREFGKLSLGQKQSVLLALTLSASSDHPLLIDQPEDNLDGEFIYQSLVPVLRRAKERRQVIVVTHNANIAVLGDAEQIVVLKSTSDKGSIVERGSIDAQAPRDAACRVLEGAREALQRRATAYGFDVKSPA